MTIWPAYGAGLARRPDAYWFPFVRGSHARVHRRGCTIHGAQAVFHPPSNDVATDYFFAF
jgi:hypothetical protein